MQLLSEHELSVTLVSDASETEPPVSEIALADGQKRTIVKSAILEAAIAWRDAFLIFLTDDIPYEETLSIYLLDGELNCLDSATLGGMYSTGFFKLSELSEPNVVRIRFIGDMDWSVELLREPEFRLPFISEPIGVSRRFGFSRRFKIQGKPCSQ
jgi:hypothetical protein